MTPKEAAVVLAKAATYDNRRPDAQAAVSWAQALNSITLTDALDAVVTHYAESTEWCRPAHIRRRVELVRAERLALVAEPALPPDLSGADYARALSAWRRQVANGGPSDVAAALESVNRREIASGS